jgi:16S rRNA processing protein RimM
MRDILHIGKITGAHGLNGEIKVFALTDDPARFSDLHECLLVTSDEKSRVPATATGARFFHDTVLLKLKGIDDRSAAEKLRGLLISVTRDQAVALPPDTWFICDLIGSQVYDQEHGLLGELVDVLQTTAHDVYTVRLPGARDLLFPVLKSVLRQVDLAAHRIDVQLPAGLYEIYRD